MTPRSAPSSTFLISRIFLPFALGYYLSYLMRTVNAVISPDLTRELGLGAAELGLLTSMYFFTFGLAQIPVGIALDRYGPRRVEAALLLITALGGVLFATGESLPTLASGRGLIGMGVSACLMAGLKGFTLWFPREKLASMTGYVMSCGALGAVTASAPLEAALPFIGWRGAFWLVAGLAASIAALIFFAMPEKDGSHPRGDLRHALRGVREVLSARVFWGFAAQSVKMSQGETTGSELVTNGTFATDLSGWSDQSVGTGTCTWSGGAVVLARTNAGNQGILQQAITTVPGKPYRISISLSVAAGKLGVGSSSLTDNYIDAQQGPGTTIDRVFIAQTTTTYIYFLATSDASSTTFDNVTCKECTSTTLSLASATYEEVTGTELVTNGTFDSGTTGWAGQNATIANVAGELEVTGAAGTGRAAQSAIPTTAGKIYKVVATGRKVTTDVNFYVYNTSDSANLLSLTFSSTSNDTQTGYFCASGSSVFAWAFSGNAVAYFDNISIKEVSPSQAWTEAETAAATITNPCVAIWSDTAGDAIDIDHVQCEIGAKASPPIITAGAAVTRAAQTFSISSSLFNIDAGAAHAMVLWGMSRLPSASTSGLELAISGTNETLVYLSDGSQNVCVSGGGVTAQQDAGTITPDALVKIASSFNTNKFNLSLNGVLATEDTSGALPVGSGGTLYVGNALAGGSQINGYISRILVAPAELTQAELQAYTS